MPGSCTGLAGRCDTGTPETPSTTDRQTLSTRERSSMEVIEFRPERAQYAFTFGGVAPVRRIQPGTVLRLWTEDAFCGNIRQVTDLPSSALTMPFVNPQTGPFYVAGAQPGDTLALHFVDLTPARSFGASCTIPLFGGLTGTDRTATLQDPLPERAWIYEVDTERQTVAFQAQASDLRVELPMDPMLGTVGVAPAAGEVRSSLVPDTFGGNMDTPEMRAGATCYLAVNVDGGLFSVGDGHYRQGEGEACGTAVEGAMDVTLVVELIKGGGPAWPRLETDEHLIVVGSSRPLEDAWRVSQVGMVTWLMDLYGLDKMDAYQLLSQTSQSPLANVVDVNYSAVTKVPKALLPPATAYDGMHRQLREIAATISW
jgi:acetamidase/formamidase